MNEEKCHKCGKKFPRKDSVKVYSEKGKGKVVWLCMECYRKERSGG
jgi:hypothetical protein